MLRRAPYNDLRKKVRVPSGRKMFDGSISEKRDAFGKSEQWCTIAGLDIARLRVDSIKSVMIRTSPYIT